MSEHTIADSVGVNTAFVAGKAYLNAICDIEHGNSVSIVSDRGDFQCVKVVFTVGNGNVSAEIGIRPLK